METNTGKSLGPYKKDCLCCEKQQQNTGLVTLMGKIDGCACPGLNLERRIPEDGICESFLPGEIENRGGKGQVE